jgi:hypothetical protein
MQNQRDTSRIHRATTHRRRATSNLQWRKPYIYTFDNDNAPSHPYATEKTTKNVTFYSCC